MNIFTKDGIGLNIGKVIVSKSSYPIKANGAFYLSVI